MKRFFPILLFVLCLSRISFAQDAPLVRHKASRRGGFDAKAEVVSFYRHLLAHSADVKGQFARLASTHFEGDETYLVKWPPFRRLRSGQKFIWDSHFLVFQPLTSGRLGQQDNEIVMISEFHVVYEGKLHWVGRIEKVSRSEITLTFLGFRKFTLSTESE